MPDPAPPPIGTQPPASDPPPPAARAGTGAPPTGAVPPTGTQPPAGEPPPTPTLDDPVRLKADRDAALREAAGTRLELKKFKDAQLSDEEKRAARLTELEAAVAERDKKLREKTSYAAVVDAAARLGAAKPAMLHRLIERDIEFDESGEPKNVEALVRDFLKANPEFASTAGRPTGSADGGVRGKTTLTREDIKKLTPQQINERWTEISEVLARGGA